MIILNELLIGQVPIISAHAAVGIAWGTLFIVWSWLNAPTLAQMGKDKHGRSEGNGGNFPYFFLDWTLPRATQYACLLGLLGVLLVFHFGAMGFRALLLLATEHGVPLLVRATCTYGLGFFMFKWRD